MKYQIRLTPTACKDIRIRNFELVAKLSSFDLLLLKKINLSGLLNYFAKMIQEFTYPKSINVRKVGNKFCTEVFEVSFNVGPPVFCI